MARLWAKIALGVSNRTPCFARAAASSAGSSITTQRAAQYRAGLARRAKVLSSTAVFFSCTAPSGQVMICPFTATLPSFPLRLRGQYTCPFTVICRYRASTSAEPEAIFSSPFTVSTVSASGTSPGVTSATPFTLRRAIFGLSVARSHFKVTG